MSLLKGTTLNWRWDGFNEILADSPDGVHYYSVRRLEEDEPGKWGTWFVTQNRIEDDYETEFEPCVSMEEGKNVAELFEKGW